MLQRLYIRNFTLIKELDITFTGGFSVITGETGAGKSIILGALGLLLGQRADTKAIKAGSDRCVVEAYFDLTRYGLGDFFATNDLDFDGSECILRREVTATGKSRAFINDTPVSLATLRELGTQLVDIHSQHQNLLLNKEDFQLNVVDILAQDGDLLSTYRSHYKAYRDAVSKLEQALDAISKNREDEDYLRYQHQELETAHLIDGEQENLEAEYELLSHSEDIKSALYDSENLLSNDGGAVERVKRASQSVAQQLEVYPALEELSSRLDSCYIELKDISDELSVLAENVEYDPARMDEVNNRLDAIYHLEQKFHVQSIADLLALKESIEKKLGQIDGSEEDITRLEKQVADLKSICEKEASQLTTIRQHSAIELEKGMRTRLVPLGIPKVKFEVQLQEKPLSADGHDKVSFLFTANSNTPLQPVSQVASGGEIARVMLSLKAMISGAVKLPTIIFDEIDTGVSGKVAEMMARIMQEMGNNDRQVISITHLPQIASRGNTHYKVYKEEEDGGTTSHMCILDKNERVKEIAQMLSGSDISSAAIQNAEELLGYEQSKTL